MVSRFVGLLGILCIVILFIILYTQPEPNQSLPSIAIQSDKISEPFIAVKYRDVSLNWQVTPRHQQSSKHLTSLTETLGSGICVIDYNNDGWMDLFFVGGSGHNRYYGRKAWWHKENGNRLLLNINGKYFEDVTEKSGLAERMWGMGCAVADFNHDGFNDLLITGVGSNYLYSNQGNGTFVDVTADSGITNGYWSTGASLADFNHDGLIDIYITNYIRYEKGARTFERTRGFRLTKGVDFDPSLYDPEPNQLYLNQGNFKFREVAKDAGVESSLGRSLGSRWFDVNKDSWLDLLVINDHNTPNQVYINQKNGHFIRGESLYSPLEVAGAHDVLINDFNNNGEYEFFMSRGMGYPSVLLSSHLTENNGSNQGTGVVYHDEAWLRGLAQTSLLPYSGWGAIAGDFNNDGLLDIYIANGLVLPDIDSHFVSQAQENSLFINKGDGNFQRESATENRHYPYSSRGVIAVDLNNDGMLEIVVSNNNNVMEIFENQSKNNNRWLAIDLLSDNNATDVYGAKIKLITDKITINRTLHAKHSFLSQGDPRVHLGLGNSQSIKELIVYWPDGQESSFKNVVPNQYVAINKRNNSMKFGMFDTSEQTPFELMLPTLKEQALTNLANTLLRADPEKVTQQLSLVWQYANDNIKTSILHHIEQNWHHRYLSIIRRALESSDLEHRSMAVQILKKAELEISIAWLIPLLNDNSIRIQCEVSATFGFFFNEEEAVTHRKKLAISPLLRLLDTGSSQVKVCAANALAIAENKRAIFPLLKLAISADTSMVRTSAIRALGLIRDTRAIVTLIELVNKPDSNAEIIASALIALHRLNSDQLAALFTAIFSLSESNSAVKYATIRNYQILSYLFIRAGGIVFKKTHLEKYLIQLNDDNKLAELTSTARTPAIIIAALSAIEAGQLVSQHEVVKLFLKHSDKSVRFQALNTMSVLNTSKSKIDFENSLVNEDFSIIITIIGKKRTSKVGLSNHFIDQLIKRINQTSTSFDQLLDLAMLLPIQSSGILFQKLIEKNLTEEQYLTLFHKCSAEKIVHTIVDKTILKHNSAKVRYAYADCYFSGDKSTTKIGNDRQNILHQRIILRDILEEPSITEFKKNSLLIKAAAFDALIAKTLLFKKSEVLARSLQADAYDVLNSHQLMDNKKPLLWKLLMNSQQPDELRFEAAMHLIAIDETKVLDFLNGYTSNNDKK